jgi:hypothetical protein
MMRSMILVAVVGLLFAQSAAQIDSTSVLEKGGSEFVLPSLNSPLHIIASSYGAVGEYSTDTRSRSVSGYVTLSNAWREYYTLGYANLWLARDDAGGKYFSQHLFSGRASWLLSNDKVALAAHCSYLYEGEIQSFSSAASFSWLGAGGTYWFSPFQYAAGSFSLCLAGGGICAGAYRGIFSFDVGNGIWSTSTAIVNDADFSAPLFSFRQSVSVPLGNESYIVAIGEIGRRGFYFDDDALIVYNQRAIQTDAVTLRGIVRTFPNVFLIPAFDYTVFDEYNVKYGSLGIKVVF